MPRAETRVIFALEEWQLELLAELFAKINRNNELGRPGGAILAQVFRDGMRVNYVGPKVAARIAKAINPKTKGGWRYDAFGRARPSPARGDAKC